MRHDSPAAGANAPPVDSTPAHRQKGVHLNAVPLYEKYRPRTFAEVVGQDRAISVLTGIRERSGTFAGRAYWFTGGTGIGKTTLARIIAAEIAGPYAIEEFNSGADLTSSELSRVVDSLGMYGLGIGGRAVIVNESHSLRADTLDRLKGILENIPRHALWCFTTTREDQEELFGDHAGAAQLLGRCIRVPLTSQGLSKAFATRLRECAQLEGLDDQPVEAYIKLLQRPDVKNSARAAWNLIESGIMLGKGEP